VRGSEVRRFDNPTVSRVNFKAQSLKLRLALTLTLTLTDTGGAVLTLGIIEPSDYRTATLVCRRTYIPWHARQSLDGSCRFTRLRLWYMQTVRVSGTDELSGRLMTKCRSVAHVKTRQTVPRHDTAQQRTAAPLRICSIYNFRALL